MQRDDHPGLGALADHMLVTVNGSEPRAIWRWLCEQMEPYPPKLVPALKPPRTTDAPRRMLAVELVVRGDPFDGTPAPVAMLTHDGMMPHRVLLDGRGDAALRVATALFTHRNRGALIVVADGMATSFAILLRCYARDLVRMGFTIEPLTAGATLRGLIVRKAKHSWTLCDLNVMTGLEGMTRGDFETAFVDGGLPIVEGVGRLRAALAGWQTLSLHHFDAAASVTVGRSAVRAATRHLGPRQWLWRTHPLAVAMLRAGGGYRGGYAAAHRYSGNAWRSDMNKAYAWALGEPLPSRLGIAREAPGSDRPDGIYLARIEGPPRVPLYIGVWQGGAGGFERVLWRGGVAWSIVTTTEAIAIEHMGCSVSLGSGMTYLSTFTLRGFVAQIAGITHIYGRGSPAERIARAYGVSVYGKLAERPEREQVMYSAASPGSAWRAFVDPHGNEIADLWSTRTIAHRPHQHVDVASEVTSLVRARLYGAIGQVLDHGGEVPHADTDGFLSSVDPSPYLASHDTAPGGWRTSQTPQRAIVWGAKGYAWGEEVRAAGFRGVSAEQAAAAYAGEMVEAQMQERGAPFGDAPLYHPLRRQVRAV